MAIFQQGIIGWAQDKWPERFGIIVEDDDALLAAQDTAEALPGKGVG